MSIFATIFFCLLAYFLGYSNGKDPMFLEKSKKDIKKKISKKRMKYSKNKVVYLEKYRRK